MVFRRSITAFTAACFLSLGFQATASASVIGTQQYLEITSRSAQLAQIEAALSRADVRAQLESLGVDPARAAERVAALSDQEIATLAARLDQAPAGGDLLGVVGVVFIVLLFLEVVGVIDIFKKI
jgi:hypothetical protein